MQWLARVCVRRPVFAAVLMLLIVVVGIAGYTRLGLDQFPDIDAPMITVTTRMAGSGPEEIETDITEKIEAAVSTISGINNLSSTSANGISIVSIDFTLEKNGDVAAEEVRDHINRIRNQLPKDADSPEVQKMDPSSSPVLYIAVRTDRALVEVTEYADKHIRRRLENLLGVGQVNVVGGRERQINVWLDPEALRAYGMTATEVKAAVAAQNLSVPGGTVESGPVDYTLRVRGRVGSPEALGAVVVRQQGSHAIRVSDVARVEDGATDSSTIATVNGESAILLTVRKQSGSNTVKVVDAVFERLDEVRKDLPAGWSLEVVRDASGLIRTSVSSVQEHLILGALLASLVVLLFLGNVRSAIVSALAIPISLIGTFALMWAAGFTLNMITLLALALAVGIVIDDAIIVLENIFRFVNEKGMKPFPAAVAATKDIGLAVLATTFSLMAVFLPVAFMSGMSGRFMRGFGVTMAFAIGVSLIVAFSLTPSLAARIIRPVPRAADGTAIEVRKGLLERLVDRLYRPVEVAYMAMLRFVMRHRWVILVASIVALASVVPLMGAVQVSFFPENDEAQFELNVRAVEGTSRSSTSLIAERIARDIRRLPGVRLTSTTIGNDSEESTNSAAIYVRLVDPDQRRESAAEIMKRTRDEITSRQSPDLHISFSESAGPGNSVQYVLTGPDMRQLGEYSQRIVDELGKSPAAVDVQTSYRTGKPELTAAIDRSKAADLGVRMSDVSDTLTLLVGGLDVSTYSEDGEQYDVHMQADRRFRSDEKGLSMVSVPSSLRGSVPLSDVVQLKESFGLASIKRDSRQRQVTVSANIAQGNGQNEVETALKQAIERVNLPSGYKAYATGFTKEAGRTMTGFIEAFLLSFIFMYLVLAAQFESWLHPLTIMLALPLTVPFALLSILLFHNSLNMFSALGLFVLFGIVKKNAILQIDHTINLRKAGRPRLEAILEANRDRLRPILMTTIAFVAGMLPLAFSKGIGAGQSRAIASVVIGGQTFSLLLTLLAIPVIYSYFDDITAWLRRTFHRSEVVDRGELEIG